MKRISITDIEGIRIGQVENQEAGTGCTVLISESGAPVGLDVRGGGPASRETELLKPLANADVLHAIVLCGGSAFGLDAAGGVMQYLEEQDIGYDVGVTKVPLVCQSDIFDLTVGDCRIRPDKKMGYDAARASKTGNYRDGNYGAGTGATVGKYYGMDYCMKSGIGSYAVQIRNLKIGAIAVVNALGDIYDWRTGKEIAGLLDENRNTLRSTVNEMFKSYSAADNKFAYSKSTDNKPAGNTTLGVIVTNAGFNKTQLCKLAGMAQNGLARTIRPVHTSADGDSIYAMSSGTVSADKDMVGTLAADVMAEAVLCAVKSAKSAYGFPAWKNLTM